MHRTALVWDPYLASYDLGDAHPLDPIRLSLTVELIDALGLLAEGNVIKPREARESELLRVHASGYIEAVRHAGDWASDFSPRMGLGTDDNPVFPGLHEHAAMACGSTLVALERVLSGEFERVFSIAGGLHHAHRARAAGFSVYNDAAVAIANAIDADPDLKVLYVDLDAHHGDGVQEAFASSSSVLTASIHQSGLFVFPGTGFPGEIGYDAGVGYSANVPMPVHATDECFAHAFDEVVAPLARAFAPDVIVAQLGVDAHWADPQTDLGMTLPGYRAMVRRVIALANELCDGRMVALGGGGYHVLETVPRAWAWVFAELAGVEISDEVPEAWREHLRVVIGHEAPKDMGASDTFAIAEDVERLALAETADSIRQARSALFAHHGLKA